MKTNIIIGGGFFGMYIAEYLARSGKKVLLFEKEKDFMQRASYVNQARVHNGYHYPRSILTALRSRISFPRFCNEFPETIDSSFRKYYAIGKILGKVTAKQFSTFCRRIGAPCEIAPHSITALMNSHFVECVFSTVEYAFDAVKLKEIMHARIIEQGVEYFVNMRVEAVKPGKNNLDVIVSPNDRPDQQSMYKAEQVYNCTYSMINSIHKNSGFAIIPLKHELTEMCLVDMPPELDGISVTIMCGPFFSFMPFPPLGLQTLSHVRYTPHYEWLDDEADKYIESHHQMATVARKSSWRAMQLDAQRYIPALSECNYHDSLWEIKTVLPRSETDDSRPILFKANHGIKGFHSIMGGKIDNVYDVIDIIEKLGFNA